MSSETINVEDAAPRTQTRRIVAGVLAVLVLCFLAVSIASQLSAIKRFDWHFSAGWLLGSVVLLLAFQGMQAALWTGLIRATGGTLPLGPGLRIFSIAIITRYVPTQILLALTRLTMLSRRGVPRSVTIASLAYEFPLAVGSAFALSVAFFVDLPALEGHWWRWLALVVPVALLALIHPRSISKLETKVSGRLRVSSEHLTLPVRQLIPFALGYVASFVVCGLGVYAFARSAYPPTHLNLRIVTSYAIGYSAAVLAFMVPGGLGARDGATATALATTLPGTVAVAVAIGVRLVQTLVELAYAGGCELWHRTRETSA